MTQYVEISCARCNEIFFISPETNAVLRRSSANFYCPFGHSLSFPQGKTEAQKLREQLDRERRDRQHAEQRVARWQDEAEHEKRRAAAFKGQATKLARRAKAGVCPCCQRTVSQLAKHMKTKHPGYSAEVVDLEAQR